MAQKKGSSYKALEFLRKCRKQKEEVFNNSPVIPPQLLEEFLDLGMNNITRLWRLYVHHKFLFYNLLDRKDPNAKAHVVESMRQENCAEMQEFITKWKSQKKAEQDAFRFRFTQLRTQTVLDSWYFDNEEECSDWCVSQESTLTDEYGKALKNWKNCLKEIRRRIDDKPTCDLLDDWRRSAISKRLILSLSDRVTALRHDLKQYPVRLADVMGNEVEVAFKEVVEGLNECLACLGRTHIEKTPEYEDENKIEKREEQWDLLRDTQVPAGLIGDLSIILMQALHSAGFDETAVIVAFLCKLKETFQCEVCDYLDVAEDGEKIVWRAATVDVDDLSPDYRKMSPEDRTAAIHERESYKKGEGISGSILLHDFTDRTVWFHVGSNDVKNDPRASEEHQSAYEDDMYPGVLHTTKAIENFWMFPVFRDHRLSGAFRVVNKIKNDTPQQLHPGGWTYLSRVQLSLLAQWLGSFLAAMQDQVHLREDFSALIQREKELKILLENLDVLSWVQSPRIVLWFLRFLTKITELRTESRSMGCSIFIAFSEKGANPLRDRFIRKYPFIHVLQKAITRSLNWMTDFCDAIDPLDGGFVFDQMAGFRHLISLQYKGTIGVEAIKQITQAHQNSLCLSLVKGSKTVSIFSKGECKAEVRLSERTGDWKFRTPGSVFNKIAEAAPKEVDNAVLKCVSDVCLELSHSGEGALFVVGKIPEGVLRFGPSKCSLRSTKRVHKSGGSRAIELKALLEIAKLDGATVIDYEGYLKAFNSNVTLLQDPPLVPLFGGRGNRHETAEKIARVCPKALVVVVSQNGGISIVHPGGKKADKDL